jgi:hypothetical protein
MQTTFDFNERQYLGFNRFGLLRRMTIMLFCFVFYFVSENTEDETADLFFFLGILVLIISAGAMMVSHLHTTLIGKSLILVGPMTFRKVEMDVSSTSNIEVKPYSNFIMNRPMFNLHRKDARRFYTHGKWCVEFNSADGELIKLGTQRPTELKAALEKVVTQK